MFKKIFALFIGAFPVKDRFKVVVVVASIINPLFKIWLLKEKNREWANKNRWGRGFNLEKGCPIALNWCLRALNDMLITPKVIIDDQKIEDLFNLQKGVFITCYHGIFMPLIIFHLKNHGFEINTWG